MRQLLGEAERRLQAHLDLLTGNRFTDLARKADESVAKLRGQVAELTKDVDEKLPILKAG